mgnify:CR=1 FL=1
MTELDDAGARLTSVQTTINKLEKARRRGEADLCEAKKKVGDVHKKASRDASTGICLDAELRKFKGRVVEEQDRAASAESQRRRADVEIEKLKDDVRVRANELERARAEARSAAEEKRELEDRARAIAGLWK